MRESLAKVVGGAVVGAAAVILAQRLLETNQSSHALDDKAAASAESDKPASALIASADSDDKVAKLDLERINLRLDQTCTAEACIDWAAREFGAGLVMSTSFGMQSAVLLHMATRIVPDIAVIWVDTGYLHRETYHFARHLTNRLRLNLKVYQSDVSTARMEAMHGQLWNKSDEVSHRVYGVMRKVEPMQRALTELHAHAMLSGVRKGQTAHRSSLGRVAHKDVGEGHYRVHPLLYWTNEDVDAYITKHNLPYHPLKRQGYVSIGDAHSTRPKKEGEDDRATRFQGKQQECGLHTESVASIAELFSVDGPNRPISPFGDPLDDNNAANMPPLHGTGSGVEIYGRAQCRFCEAAKRVLTAKSIYFRWHIVQRYNAKTGVLEPADCDGVDCVDRETLARRIDHAAPGLPPFETVPQIFIDGEYVGGFQELCEHYVVPKAIMDVALLAIGNRDGVEDGCHHTWNELSANKRRSPPSLSDLYENKASITTASTTTDNKTNIMD